MMVMYELPVNMDVVKHTLLKKCNQNRVPIACKHGCGKTYASKEMAGLHERTCERNQNRVPIACKHGCGKTYASKEMAGLHERTCKRNQDRVPIGGGIPQQHFQNMPRGSDKTMRLVRSAMQANLRLYRRNLTERTRYEYNM